MPFTLKADKAQARARLCAFWAGSSLGRPALHIEVARGGESLPWPGDPRPSLANDRSPAWHAWRAQNALKHTTFLAEAMPCATLRFGALLTVLAVLAGGEYTYHSDSGWISPLPDIWERPLPRFDPEAPAAQNLWASLDAVSEAVGPRGYVNPPVMLDGLTTLSGFRTPEQLCHDLLERPEQVKAWSRALTDLYLDAYSYFDGRLRELGHQERSSWLKCTAEGRMEAVQCDFAVMLSPAMFEEFVLPDLARTVAGLDYSLYHLDGVGQMRFLDLLRRLPTLNGIQWNPEPGQGSVVEWLGAFRRIRELGFCLYVSCDTVDEAISLTRALGPDGLFLVLPPFEAEPEARQAIDDIAASC